MSGTSTWDIITSVGTAVGGLGAAVGAIAAWFAARASQQTSRDALEALALAVEPTVHVDVYETARDAGQPAPGPTRLAVNVRNSGRWPATQVAVRVTYADGEVLTEEHELLDTMAAGGDIDIALRDVTTEWPRHDSPEPLEVAVRYSDSKGLARYEQCESVLLRGGQLPNGAVQTHDEHPRWRRLR